MHGGGAGTHSPHETTGTHAGIYRVSAKAQNRRFGYTPHMFDKWHIPRSVHAQSISNGRDGIGRSISPQPRMCIELVAFSAHSARCIGPVNAVSQCRC